LLLLCRMTCLRHQESDQPREGVVAVAGCQPHSPPSPALSAFFQKLSAEDDDCDLAGILHPETLLAEDWRSAVDAVPAWISTDSWPGTEEAERSHSMSPTPPAAGSGTGSKADPFRTLSTQLSTLSTITAAECRLPEDLAGPRPFSAGSLQRLVALASPSETAAALAQAAAGSRGPVSPPPVLPRQESLVSAGSGISRTSTLRLPALLPPAMVGQASTGSEGLAMQFSVLKLPVLAPELMPTGWGPLGEATAAAGGGDHTTGGLRRAAGATLVISQLPAQDH
jgi:hypothetical protein